MAEETNEQRQARYARYEEERQRRDKVDRTLKTTVTYLRKSRDSMWWWGREKRIRSTYYWDVLDTAIETATYIIEELEDSFFVDEASVMSNFFGVDWKEIMPNIPLSDIYNSSDSRLEAAEKLVAAIVKRRERAVALRRIRALENVKGRSPEEAAAYQAKAKELREKLDS